ncbi:hypothetical protein MD484_g5307, partial [Candolleomyces efflorescens]
MLIPWSSQIDVQHAKDVKAAFRFSKSAKVPLTIKNTGHDYIGRSSAPGSLGLWLHNLQDRSFNPAFIPQGCGGLGPTPSVTLGAGVRWGDAHKFAHEHNITLVGGSDKSVGAVGGWLQGGGHGALSNTMGLGADRVVRLPHPKVFQPTYYFFFAKLEFQVVTPDGELRIANECQNSDLFWALRGGGGGTFGVVLSATVRASPPVKLQTLILTWSSPNATRTKEAWTIFTDASVQLAEEGWGGYVMANVFVLINPKFASWDEAKAGGIKRLVEWGQKIQLEDQERKGKSVTTLVMKEFPSWMIFFEVFTSRFVASVGKNLALASRLIPTSLFQTPENRSSLVDALIEANSVPTNPSLIILFTTPYSTPDAERKTSVHPAWRESMYHITVVEPWAWNATKREMEEAYETVGKSVDGLRKLTREVGASAAYSNEADVYEPDWESAFWGENYPRLLDIKRKYDPDQLLDCWHCVGFKKSSNQRFGCYLDL